MVLVQLKRLLFGPGAARSQPVSTFSRDVENGQYGHTVALSDSAESTSDAESSCHLLREKASFDTQGSFFSEESASIKASRIDPRVISDATIGLSDGLTVPFALTAGLSAIGDSKVVIYGGLAELIAGAISMGLGGWLAARSEADAQETLLSSTGYLVQNAPAQAAAILREQLAPLVPDTAMHLLEDLTDQMLQKQSMEKGGVSTNNQGTGLPELLMRLQHGTLVSSSNRAFTSAFTIGCSYFLGGFVPLFPYFFVPEAQDALWWSVGVMVFALGLFGALKTFLTSAEAGFETVPQIAGTARSLISASRWKTLRKCLKGALVMILLGLLAAAAAVGVVTLFSYSHSADQ